MLDMLDRITTTKPTPRFTRIRDTFTNLKPTIDINIARIQTRVMKETEGEPMVTRRAKVFAAVVREMPINIAPDELFVGYLTATRGGASAWVQVGPRLASVLGIEDDSVFDGGGMAGWYRTPPLPESEKPFILSDEDKRELREEILPYWRGPEGKYERTPWGRDYKDLLPPEAANIFYADPESGLNETASCVPHGPSGTHYGHAIYNWRKILEKGFLGIKKDAEERLARLDYTDPDEFAKIPFLKGVIMAMETASEIGKRFAAKARDLAAKEKNAERKVELLNIAEICDWVPANPARTFYEAMQSVWFAYILCYWEIEAQWSISPGRLDQYLYPYYEKDIREGRLTKEEAQELINCWLLRLPVPTFNYGDGHLFVIQDAIVTHVSVGGCKEDGSDATNELSYMFIEAMMHNRLPEPDFSVLIHSKVPDDLLIKGCKLAALGYGQPEFQNCDVMIPGLLDRSRQTGAMITLKDARNASGIGCQEPFIDGMDSHNQSGYVNLPMCLELALNNGVSRYFHRKMGVETGDPRTFKSFEEVREAYKKQQAWVIRNMVIGSNIHERDIAEMLPTLYQSALIEDCIENGICREAGGARFNSGPGYFATGIPDVGDALAAIKKLVFEDKKVTMAELCDALDNNFEGYEELHKMCLEVPKYGNDDDYADEQVVQTAHEWAAEVIKHKNTRGGYAVPGWMSLMSYVPYGEVVGALPSGRLAGTPLANSAGPCGGNDMNGPTAVLKSLGKTCTTEISNGTVLNMRLDTAVFKNRDGFKRLADLIRTVIDEKIFLVQFNVISSDIMRAAQKEPDKYKDLVVRVAGYSARFVALPESMQNDIIARTEHEL